LTTREQEIIKLRYFKDKTQGEVAKILGVSQVQISRLENKILANLAEKYNK
jgi:RNA polymerase sporulation-specific sigma factor